MTVRGVGKPAPLFLCGGVGRTDMPATVKTVTFEVPEGTENPINTADTMAYAINKGRVTVPESKAAELDAMGFKRARKTGKKRKH